ncbi:MAG: putative DNA repair protein MutK [Pseudohongiellaceae bacterium]
MYLCFEGVEKIWHSIAHKSQNKAHKESLRTAIVNSQVDLVEFEKTKIKGAIRTDFVLNESLMTQGLVVGLIARLMTVGVYGVVAFIVKLDDMGLYLMAGESVEHIAEVKKSFGRLILAFCPFLMKGLSIIGTAAMFLVGGGIIVHGGGFYIIMWKLF